jgi:hypothetical protein
VAVDQRTVIRSSPAGSHVGDRSFDGAVEDDVGRMEIRGGDSGGGFTAVAVDYGYEPT